MAKKSSRISSAEKKRLAYALIALVTAAILLIIPQTRNRVLEYLGFFDTDSPQAEIPDGEIAVHFIDVGQGDAELIMTSDGKTVLIDSGTPESRTVLTGYLKEQGVKKIDYFVLTHPHADHIGGAAAVLDAFDVVNVIMTDAPTTTSTYKKVLQKIDEKDCGVIFAEAGKEYSLGEAKITILGPVSDYSDDLNNTSIVLRLTYGRTAFMFTGDAEKKAEQDMLTKFPAVIFQSRCPQARTSRIVNLNIRRMVLCRFAGIRGYLLRKEQRLRSPPQRNSVAPQKERNDILQNRYRREHCHVLRRREREDHFSVPPLTSSSDTVTNT